MRRRLPHIRDPGHFQHIVFCTRGAFIAALPETPDRVEIADRLLDESPHGRVLMGAAADAVADVLQRRGPEDYLLLAWCVMPNHVHALVRPVIALDTLVGAWKSVSARAVNRVLGRAGPLWQSNYFDRLHARRRSPQRHRPLHRAQPRRRRPCVETAGLALVVGGLKGSAGALARVRFVRSRHWRGRPCSKAARGLRHEHLGGVRRSMGPGPDASRSSEDARRLHTVRPGLHTLARPFAYREKRYANFRATRRPRRGCRLGDPPSRRPGAGWGRRRPCASWRRRGPSPRRPSGPRRRVRSASTGPATRDPPA